LRRRYLALRAEGDRRFDERDLMDAVWNMVFRLFGEVGASETGLSMVKGAGADGVVVVRCSHNTLGMIRAAVAAVTEFYGERMVVRVVEVSGTLSGLRQKLAKRREIFDCE